MSSGASKDNSKKPSIPELSAIDILPNLYFFDKDLKDLVYYGTKGKNREMSELGKKIHSK